MNKKSKGSLTIEAALTLPIFMFAVIFVSFFIKVLYVQENMSHLLHQTANEMAVYAHAYDKVGLKELQQSAYNYYRESKSGLEDILPIFEKGVGLLEDNQGEGYFHLFKEDASNNKKVGFSGNIQKNELLEGFTEDGLQFYDGMIYFAEVFLHVLANHESLSHHADGFEFVIDNIGIQGVKGIFRTYIKEETLKSYGIVDGYKGLDFGRSQFLLVDDTIDLVLTYRVKVPIPLKVVEEIPIMQRVVVRAWTGNNHQVFEGREDKDTVRVYVAKTALENQDETVYHTDASCYYINRILTAKQRSEVEQDPCNICVGPVDLPDTFTVYVTQNGEKYHISLECSTITRYIFYLPLEDLGEKARLCSRCEASP